MQRGMPFLMVALLLCVAAVSEAELGHQCIHDRLTAQQESHNRALGRPAVAEARLLPAEAQARSPFQSLDSALPATKADQWRPIRIAVSTLDLNDPRKYCTVAGEDRFNLIENTLTCTSADVFTAAKKSLLLSKVLPDAIALNADRLLVQPLNGSIEIPVFTGLVCPNFNVPATHQTNGVPGTDFILYVSAAPTMGSTVAWATTCSYLNGRPVVGVTNISPRFIENRQRTIRVAAHEILHSLGFSGTLFARRGMVVNMTIRGKQQIRVVNTTNVLARTRAQYGCNTTVGMELEDDGESGTAGSHWKRRNAKDDIMAGIVGVCHYTAMTIAAMEDTGFYRGNYAKAETMVWGLNAGCSLLEEKCVENGVSKHPSMFCVVNNSRSCTSDRTAVGACQLAVFPTAFPAHLQYFADPYVAGNQRLVDRCPLFNPVQNGSCDVGTSAALPGSVILASARCLDGTALRVRGLNTNTPGICADVKCGEGSYEIRVKGSQQYVRCVSGQQLQPSLYSNEFVSGNITCPPYDEVCVGNVWRKPDAAVAPRRATIVAALMALCVACLVLVA